MTSFWPAREILPGLWIGSKADSQSFTFLHKHRIALVVNCTADLPTTLPEFMGLRCVRVPVDDAPSESNKFARAVPAALFGINEALKSGQGVLVHCFAGVSRSSSVVACYLMKKFPRQFPALDSAIAFIQRRKPETFKSAGNDAMVNFRTALKRFESRAGPARSSA